MSTAPDQADALSEPIYCGLCLYGSDLGVPGYDNKGPAHIHPACPDHNPDQPNTEDDDPICGDRYDDEACELEPGHNGAHCAGILCWDYGRAPTEEPTP